MQTLCLPQSRTYRCFSLRYLCSYNQLPSSIIKISGSKWTVPLTIAKFHLHPSSPGLWFIQTRWAPVPPAYLASFPNNNFTFLVSSETQIHQTQLQTPSCRKNLAETGEPSEEEDKEGRILMVIKHRKNHPKKEKASRGQMNGADDTHLKLPGKENKK